VNAKILDVVQSLLQEGIEVGEILSTKPKPKPDPPGWLTPDMKKEDMGTDRLSQFVAWKKMVAEWHTKRKLSMTQFGRMYSATRTAEYFRNVDAIYFVYFADYRGRLYPMTYGVNPQGSDLQKGLLTFSKGEPLDTPEAERWFLIHGSNKWGFDKGTLNERVEFTKAHCDEWCSYAEDPINNLGWTKADCPIQFLAWCMELQEFVRNPDFVSRIPISMDGSCNGLQNLSAMLRDEIGGEATNLTKSATMQDIYRRVAQSATVRMRDLAVSLPSEEEREFARKWLAHGISRSVVKRSVMTTPYGVTVLSATDYVIQDYLEKEDHPFDITDHRPAAKVLMKAVWPAIGDVVVKGRQLMDWLRKSARAIIKDRVLCGQTPVIHWVTPSGFPATQTYYEQTVIKVRTHLFGDEVIKVAVENDNPNVNAHATGVAPNFVHSMDASHLHMVASECKRRGITSLAMIHDDYGTHARHSDTLFKVIREQFVKMYDNHDPVTEFHDANPETPKPPTKGTLNIHGVLDSEFFFS
jgi:DNA-directed RNA polymerase